MRLKQKKKLTITTGRMFDNINPAQANESIAN